VQARRTEAPAPDFRIASLRFASFASGCEEAVTLFGRSAIFFYTNGPEKKGMMAAINALLT
jgi:hypothetical protein